MSDPPPPLADSPVLEELKTVVGLIQQQTGAVQEPALGLLRVLHGCNTADWQAFAALHGLENWLAIPLEQQPAQAIATLIQAQETLAFQRDHDTLTGLGNRRLFERTLKNELERAQRSHLELSLVMIDLDFFKRVNDTYGHPCGDIVLATLGKYLSAAVRPYDTIARIGGEEFAVLLPATSCWTALAMAKRLLTGFAQKEFNCRDIAFSMTFSAGVSSVALLPTPVTGAHLIESADAALYRAKEQGKNRAVLAHTLKEHAQDTLVHAHEKQFLLLKQGEE